MKRISPIPIPPVAAVPHTHGDHGACPYGDPRDGCVYWVDTEGRALHRWSEATGSHQTWSLPSRPGACAPRADGEVMVALEDGFYAIDLEFGAVDPVADPERYEEGNRFGFGRVDPNGAFWSASCHGLSKMPTGKLYRLDGDGTFRTMLGGLTQVSGFDWSPDGRHLYLVDAIHRRVDRYAISEDGTRIDAMAPPIRLRRGEGWPAGLTVARDGTLLLAQYGGGVVSHWTPEGRSIARYRLPVPFVTGCAFAGPDQGTLFITTARRDIPRQPERAGALFRLDLATTRGQPFVAYDPATPAVRSQAV